jgi:glycosyltransferase involved in cell wall biosynthesis
MLRIAHVIKSLNRGGAEVLLREMFEDSSYTSLETTSSLIVLDKSQVSLLSELKTKQVSLFNIFSLSFLLEAYRLFQFLKSNNYDVIHCHLPLSGTLVALYKIVGLRSKLVYTEHNMPGHYNKFTFCLLGILYGLFDFVIFVSDAVKLNVEKKRSSWFFNYKCGETILNGVNTHKFIVADKGPIKDYFTVGIVASFRKVKRFDRWIQIARMLETKAPGTFRFIIAGDGAEMQNNIDLITSNHLQDIIELPGIIYNTQEFFQKLDFFLMTSDWEGLPVSLLEAMASGCVPVASNVGGINQLNISSFGCTYEKNDLSEPVSFILNAVQEPAQIAAFGKMARKFVEDGFSLKRQLQQTLVIYHNLIKT